MGTCLCSWPHIVHARRPVKTRNRHRWLAGNADREHSDA
jgi:hypothetical protein